MCYYLYLSDLNYLLPNDFHKIHPGFLCPIFVTLKKESFLEQLIVLSNSLHMDTFKAYFS